MCSIPDRPDTNRERRDQFLFHLKYTNKHLFIIITYINKTDAVKIYLREIIFCDKYQINLPTIDITWLRYRINKDKLSIGAKLLINKETNQSDVPKIIKVWCAFIK